MYGAHRNISQFHTFVSNKTFFEKNVDIKVFF